MRNDRVSGGFLGAARRVLSEKGVPTELSALVGVALERRPLTTGAEILGQDLYWAAKCGEDGFVVEEYPRFKLMKLKPKTRLPSRGYVAAAFKVLSSPDSYRGHLDVREIAQRALEARYLKTVSPVPEYWMSVQLASSPGVFLRSGQLTLGLNDWRQPTNVSAAARKMSAQGRRPSGITEGIYERDIESLIAERLDVLEQGLKLVGRQYETPVGRIDLLCKDTRGNLVVVELKSFAAKTGEVVDQITRYMGYIRTHLASRRQIVRGIIVVGQVDKNLAYAIVPIPNLEIRTFHVTITNAPFVVPSDDE
jgi:hypothetical protein